VASRQSELSHPIWEGRESDLLPLCDARCALRPRAGVVRPPQPCSACRLRPPRASRPLAPQPRTPANALPTLPPARSASDSANLDRVAELMVRTGYDPQEALMLLVPEAYRNHPDLMKNYPEVVDFYEYWE
jgi:glutamate synthase domain-containing protein 1